MGPRYEGGRHVGGVGCGGGGGGGGGWGGGGFFFGVEGGGVFVVVLVWGGGLFFWPPSLYSYYPLGGPPRRAIQISQREQRSKAASNQPIALFFLRALFLAGGADRGRKR